MRNLATFLPLKSELSEKLQHFITIDGSIKMLKIIEFPKLSIKIENFKTFYNVQTATQNDIVKTILEAILQNELSFLLVFVRFQTFCEKT